MIKKGRKEDKFVDVKYRNWPDIGETIFVALIVFFILMIPVFSLISIVNYADIEINIFCDDTWWNNGREPAYTTEECNVKNVLGIGAFFGMLISLLVAFVITGLTIRSYYDEYKPKIVRYKVKTNGKIKDGEQISP